MRSRREVPLAFEPLEPRVVLDAASPIISEIMAVNASTLLDEDGDSSDWIEIYNPSESAVDLRGWYLTDDADELTKWELPQRTLAAEDYLVVFASGKDRTAAGAPLHTNFQLAGEGEYLALVKADGATVAYEFSPAYPEQFADIAYGHASGTAVLIPDGDRLTYLVPGVEEAELGTGWTDADFNDSAWDGFAASSRIVITEIGTSSPDYVEIQNVHDRAVDTSGWVVAVNNSTVKDVNDVHPILWHLPGSMSAGQVLYRSDDVEDAVHYWGGDVRWATTWYNWAMIIDDHGNVVDFVSWRYSPEQLEALNATINGHPITLGDSWSGSSVSPNGADREHSMQRIGEADTNTAADWTVAAVSMGQPNAGLATPFSTEVATGLGFDAAATGLADAVQIDVAAAMHGVNASLWARIPFQMGDPSVLDSLQLWIKYNDGFVAYLNGQEIARRNAPDSLPWNATATASQSVAESLEFEAIDVTDSLVWLRPGRNVLAIHALNLSAADPNFLVQADLFQGGKRYFGEPTPGATNSTAYTGLVEDTRFSADRGFFEQPFSVEIATDTPGTAIYYTLDGSKPTETHGLAYTGPITVSTTTVLRAAAFKPGYKPSNVDTQTYLFLADVIRQPNDPAGYPSTWDGRPADYEMDPDVVGPNNLFADRYRDTILDDLQSLPTMSVVMDVDDLFGSSGIYVNTQSTGDAWERAASAELISPDGSEPGFQIDCGIRVQGGASRSPDFPKHSFRLEFRSGYGDSRLRYPLFDDQPYGDSPADSFDEIVLRAPFNNSWPHWHFDQAPRAQYIRDQWARDLQFAMGQRSAHGRYVHLYLNGIYWGIYNLGERPAAPFMETYYGGDEDDYDVLNSGSPIDGDKQ
ncbi:MAG TPA: lamin tail domain-containing protein, partial [Thermoguttaceae bacterium]|nr:lamin tail domain-containing protein [Thermoguttaceae bacterium]